MLTISGASSPGYQLQMKMSNFSPGNLRRDSARAAFDICQRTCGPLLDREMNVQGHKNGRLPPTAINCAIHHHTRAPNTADSAGFGTV
jgi:hypothetical protein